MLFQSGPRIAVAVVIFVCVSFIGRLGQSNALVSQIMRLGISMANSKSTAESDDDHGLVAGKRRSVQHNILHGNTLLETTSRFSSSSTNCATLPTECSTCTVHPHCRFCLVKHSSTKRFIVNNGSTSDVPGLKGVCIDLQATTWREPLLITQNPPVYAHCSLILPDYLNGLTCFDADAGFQYETYRETLETIQPLFSEMQLIEGENFTLERVLRQTIDPAPQHSPIGIVLMFVGVPLLSCLGCGCCFAVLWRCCNSGVRLCCCGCCGRKKAAVRANMTPQQLPCYPVVPSGPFLLPPKSAEPLSPSTKRTYSNQNCLQSHSSMRVWDTAFHKNSQQHLAEQNVFYSTGSTICSISEHSPVSYTLPGASQARSER